MLKTAIDTELQLKIIKMIADLDNMKRDEVTEEKKVILFYLPYKECSECPNRKLYIKNNNSFSGKNYYFFFYLKMLRRRCAFQRVRRYFIKYGIL